MSAYNHSVVPGKDGELIEAGDKIPSSGDVASYEDAKSQDGEGVHRRIARRATAGAFRKMAEMQWAYAGRYLAGGVLDHGAGCGSKLGAKRYTVFRGKRSALPVEVREP